MELNEIKDKIKNKMQEIPYDDWKKLSLTSNPAYLMAVI